MISMIIMNISDVFASAVELVFGLSFVLILFK